jgi:hypothetical protein
MGPALLESVFKGTGFSGIPPQKPLASRQSDLFAPSEAGYTTDGTDFDFSDEDGSDAELDSLRSVGEEPDAQVEESAVSIGEHSPLYISYCQRALTSPIKTSPFQAEAWRGMAEQILTFHCQERSTPV